MPHLAGIAASKTVGFLGGLALVFNQMTGPAIPFTSANFQSPGWLPTSLLYAVFAAVSGFSMLFLVDAIRAIPGNRHFQGSVEYGTIINFYFGPRLHYAAQLVLYGALQSSAIQGIVLTAQATDNLLVLIFGKTCGLSFSSGWVCVTAEVVEIPSPFGNSWMVFTLGLLIVMLLSIPLGLADMDNNITFNIVTSLLSLILGASWLYSSFVTGVNVSRIPVVAPFSLKYGQVVGTVLLNLGATTVIPSWLNLRHKDVNVQNLIWTATIGSSIYYVLIGIICGAGFDLDSSGNLLHSLLIDGKPAIVATVSIGVFAYVMLLPSIPVSFIVSRDNLVQNNVAPQGIATFLSFVLPWLFAVPLQTGEAIFDFQTWMSLVFCSSANFIIPFVIFIKCEAFRKQYNERRVLTEHQCRLLRQIHSKSDRIRSFIDRHYSKSPSQNSDEMHLHGIGDAEDDAARAALPQIVIDDYSSIPVDSNDTIHLACIKPPAADVASLPASPASGSSTESPGAGAMADPSSPASAGSPLSPLSIVYVDPADPEDGVDAKSPLSAPPTPAGLSSDSHAHSIAGSVLAALGAGGSLTRGAHVRRSSHDVLVALRPENAVGGVIYMSETSLGLPRGTVDEDIPASGNDEDRHPMHGGDEYDVGAVGVDRSIQHGSAVSRHSFSEAIFNRLTAVDPKAGLAELLADWHGGRSTDASRRARSPPPSALRRMSAPAPCLPHLGVPEHGDAPKMQYHNSWDGHGDAGPHQFGQFLDAQHRPAGPGSWHPAGGNDGGATGSRRSRSSSRSSRRGSRVSDRRSLDSQATSGSDGSHISKRSLPREAGFVSPPFRIVPPWLPVSERGVMRTLLVVTAAVCIGNLVVYGWLQATRSK